MKSKLQELLNNFKDKYNIDLSPVFKNDNKKSMKKLSFVLSKKSVSLWEDYPSEDPMTLSDNLQTIDSSKYQVTVQYKTSLQYEKASNFVDGIKMFSLVRKYLKAEIIYLGIRENSPIRLATSYYNFKYEGEYFKLEKPGESRKLPATDFPELVSMLTMINDIYKEFNLSTSEASIKIQEYKRRFNTSEDSVYTFLPLEGDSIICQEFMREFPRRSVVLNTGSVNRPIFIIDDEVTARTQQALISERIRYLESIYCNPTLSRGSYTGSLIPSIGDYTVSNTSIPNALSFDMGSGEGCVFEGINSTAPNQRVENRINLDAIASETSTLYEILAEQIETNNRN